MSGEKDKEGSNKPAQQVATSPKRLTPPKSEPVLRMYIENNRKPSGSKPSASKKKAK